MKKLLVFLIVALLVLPGVVLAQNDTLSRDQINRISDSVVLVLAFDSSGQPLKSGSGTIISPTGLIYTNRHVVEDAADFAILTLVDVGEAAQLTYYATPVLVHQEVDFAELQIDRDANGKAIDSSSLNLPYITMANVPPEIGDRIFVFGYPDLGDAHLVMTSGSITTIENDTLNNQRIPYWYQTDAQISPGNSGGLVVNTSGQMVGIPTQVRSEERTLGRLGGILSLAAINGALQNQQGQQQVLQVPTAVPNGKATPIPPLATQEVAQQLTVEITNVEHNYTYNDNLGMKVHVSAEAIGYKDTPLRAAIFASWGDDTEMMANNRASEDYRAPDGQLTLQQVVTPGYDDTIYDDLWFFIPYDVLPDGRTGTYDAYLEAWIGLDGQTLNVSSAPVTFNYTYPTQQLIADITNIDFDAQVNNVSGMKVHAHIRTFGYQGQTLRVALFTYWKDGTPIPGSNAPSDFQSPAGNLTVQDTITPSYDNSQWSDLWFFVPYDYFPTGLKGDQDALAEIEIGVDGGDFISWSQDEPFTLSYGS